MMVPFIEQLSQGLPYDAEQVIGYSTEELGKLERLYDVKISGDLKVFLAEMGRCDGGLIGDDPIILYRAAKTVRGFVLLQSGIKEEIYDTGAHEIAGASPFVFSVESETQYFFVATKSDNPDRVYQYDENNETVRDTGLSFLEYMKQTVKVWGGKSAVVCRGELLIV